MGRIYFSFPGVLGLAMWLDMNKERGSHNIQVASLVLKRLVLLALVAHLRLPQKRGVLGSLLVPDWEIPEAALDLTCGPRSSPVWPRLDAPSSRPVSERLIAYCCCMLLRFCVCKQHSDSSLVKMCLFLNSPAVARVSVQVLPPILLIVHPLVPKGLALCPRYFWRPLGVSRV